MTADDDGLRVGTPERELAIDILNDALVRGYLDIDEFTQRSGAVYAARTRGDLRPVVADLPQQAAVLPSTSNGLVVAAVLELDLNWRTVTRSGGWHVPPRVLITGSMGSADLDFDRAQFSSATVDIEIQVGWSSLKMRLPPSVRVDYDQVSLSSMSSLKDKSGPPSNTALTTLVLRGGIRGTSIVLRSG